MDGLGELAGAGVQLPHVPEGVTPAYHLFYLLLPSAGERTRVMDELRTSGIGVTFHYVPLHDAPAAAAVTSRRYDCPVASDVSSRLLRLPLYPTLTGEEQSRVIAAVQASVG